jgi:hypothetical protein
VGIDITLVAETELKLVDSGIEQIEESTLIHLEGFPRTQPDKESPSPVPPLCDRVFRDA